MSFNVGTKEIVGGVNKWPVSWSLTITKPSGNGNTPADWAIDGNGSAATYTVLTGDNYTYAVSGESSKTITGTGYFTAAIDAPNPITSKLRLRCVYADYTVANITIFGTPATYKITFNMPANTTGFDVQYTVKQGGEGMFSGGTTLDVVQMSAPSSQLMKQYTGLATDEMVYVYGQVKDADYYEGSWHAKTGYSYGWIVASGKPVLEVFNPTPTDVKPVATPSGKPKPTDANTPPDADDPATGGNVQTGQTGGTIFVNADNSDNTAAAYTGPTDATFREGIAKLERQAIAQNVKGTGDIVAAVNAEKAQISTQLYTIENGQTAILNKIVGEQKQQFFTDQIKAEVGTVTDSVDATKAAIDGLGEKLDAIKTAIESQMTPELKSDLDALRGKTGSQAGNDASAFYSSVSSSVGTAASGLGTGLGTVLQRDADGGTIGDVNPDYTLFQVKTPFWGTKSLNPFEANAIRAEGQRDMSGLATFVRAVIAWSTVFWLWYWILGEFKETLTALQNTPANGESTAVSVLLNQTVLGTNAAALAVPAKLVLIAVVLAVWMTLPTVFSGVLEGSLSFFQNAASDGATRGTAGLISQITGAPAWLKSIIGLVGKVLPLALMIAASATYATIRTGLITAQGVMSLVLRFAVSNS